jgi:hypothetical protein
MCRIAEQLFWQPDCPPSLASALRQTTAVEVFEHSDREIAANAGVVSKLGRRKQPVLVRLGKTRRCPRESSGRLGREIPMLRDLEYEAEVLGMFQKGFDRRNGQSEAGSQVADGRRSDATGGQQRLDALPEQDILRREHGPVPGPVQPGARAQQFAIFDQRPNAFGEGYM